MCRWWVYDGRANDLGKTTTVATGSYHRLAILVICQMLLKRHNALRLLQIYFVYLDLFSDGLLVKPWLEIEKPFLPGLDSVYLTFPEI